MSQTTIWILIVVALVVAVLLLAISSAILRSLAKEEAAEGVPPSWTQLVDESLVQADAQLRLDIVERLAIVNSSWSRDVLHQAKKQERNQTVRSAIELALER